MRLICDLCRETFDRTFSLNRHKANVHSQSEQRYACKECAKTFPRRDNLRRHERAHRADGLVLCDICCRGFRSDYIPQHTERCKKRRASGLKNTHLVLKVRAQPARHSPPLVLENEVYKEHAMLEQSLELTRKQSNSSMDSNGPSDVPYVSEELKEETCRKLRESIEKGDIEQLTSLLGFMHSFGASTHEARDAIFQEFHPLHTKATLLLHACFTSATNVAEYLLESGSAISEKDTDGDSALHCACYRGNERLVELLLARNADLDAYNSTGATPIGLATKKSQASCIRILVHAGAQIDRRKSTDYFSPLQFVCRFENRDMAKVLIGCGADLNLGPKTPLSLALQYGSSQLCAILLEAGASMNSIPGDCHAQLLREASGSTASTRPSSDALEKIRLLARYSEANHSADVNGATPNGTSVVLTYRAVELIHSGQIDESMLILQYPGSEMTPKPSLDHVCLVYKQLYGDILINATSAGHLRLVDMLLDHGHNADAIDSEGFTALHIASMAGRTDLVKALLLGGASVDFTSQGKTPLCIAASEGHWETVHYLLEQGANVDAGRDTDQMTPLEHALSSWTKFSESTIIRLIEYGADVNQGSQQCPLERAILYSTAQSVYLLLTAGAEVDRISASCMTELRKGRRKQMGGYVPILAVDQKLRLLAENGTRWVLDELGRRRNENGAFRTWLRSGE